MRRNVIVLAMKRGYGIGDAVMCTPLFKAIKGKYPGSRTLLFFRYDTHGAPLARNPYIDAGIRVRGPVWRLLLGLGLRLFRPVVYRLEMYHSPVSLLDRKNVKDVIGSIFDIEIRDPEPELFVTSEEDKSARRRLEEVSDGKAVVLVQAISRASRNHLWPHERWGELVRSCPNYSFVQIGRTDEPFVPGCVDFRGKTSLRALFAIAKHSTAFVGLDASLSHIAYGVKLPGVVLYGTTDPSYVGHSTNINIYKNVACAPCYYMNHGKVDCPYGHECMDLITVDEVKMALDLQVSKRTSAPGSPSRLS